MARIASDLAVPELVAQMVEVNDLGDAERQMAALCANSDGAVALLNALGPQSYLTFGPDYSGTLAERFAHPLARDPC